MKELNELETILKVIEETKRKDNIKVSYRKFNNTDYTFIHGFKYKSFRLGNDRENVDYFCSYFKGKNKRTEKARIEKIKKQMEATEI